MTDNNSTRRSKKKAMSPKPKPETQKILVFQQNGSGEKKIAGIRKYGGGRFSIDVISIDTPLPAVIDDEMEYIPKDIDADLVLDFLKHPDLSQDLAAVCGEKKIPVVASGKKLEMEGVHTTGGLSNISYGLPQRRVINRCFLAMMVAHGFDSAIMDPLDREAMEVVLTADMIAGNDDYCMRFIKATRSGAIGS